jgi:hypothetical protein
VKCTTVIVPSTRFDRARESRIWKDAAPSAHDPVRRRGRRAWCVSPSLLVRLRGDRWRRANRPVLPPATAGEPGGYGTRAFQGPHRTHAPWTVSTTEGYRCGAPLRAVVRPNRSEAADDPPLARWSSRRVSVSKHTMRRARVLTHATRMRRRIFLAGASSPPPRPRTASGRPSSPAGTRPTFPEGSDEGRSTSEERHVPRRPVVLLVADSSGHSWMACVRGSEARLTPSSRNRGCEAEASIPTSTLVPGAPREGRMPGREGCGVRSARAWIRL